MCNIKGKQKVFNTLLAHCIQTDQILLFRYVFFFPLHVCKFYFAALHAHLDVQYT